MNARTDAGAARLLDAWGLPAVDPDSMFENEAGQPTIAARDEILAFFARRLAS